jgi:ferredoxin
MSQDELHMHYVCTHDEAEKLIKSHDQFWVSNCGCREGKGGCARSRMDVCLMFKGDIGSSGSAVKILTPAEAWDIMVEANEKHLVTRPFRDYQTKTETEGICFCCDDCCGYFLDKNEICDKGKYIENTDKDSCTLCGDCVDVCYFKAREISGDEMKVSSDDCYGCGMCAQYCPEKCIEMVGRG